MPTETLRVMGWNTGLSNKNRNAFNNGDRSDLKETHSGPVVEFVTAQRTHHHVTTAALIDTFGIRETIGNDAAIAKALGFNTAIFMELGDERIAKIIGKGAGSTFATNHEVEKLRALDLSNRQGTTAVLNLGGRAVQVASAYFDDLSSETREKQIKAALNDLEKDVPTLLVGDLNELQQGLVGASTSTRLHRVGFATLAAAFAVLPAGKEDSTLAYLRKLTYYKSAVTELRRPGALPVLEAEGWVDTDPSGQPTVRKAGIRLKVDGTYSRGLDVKDYRVIPSNGTSDHDATLTDITFAKVA